VPADPLNRMARLSLVIDDWMAETGDLLRGVYRKSTFTRSLAERRADDAEIRS